MSDWRFPDEVRGWLSMSEGAMLSMLADGKRVLEIGSYHGRSTICMAQVALHLDSIDHHRGDAGSGSGGTLPYLQATIERYGVGDKVTLHVASTLAAAPKLEANSFDLVFIDGSHDSPSVRIDMNAALRLVKPGGVIALHDWPDESVQSVVREMMGAEPNRMIDRLAWYLT